MKTRIFLTMQDRNLVGKWTPEHETVIINCDTTDASDGDRFNIYLPDAFDTQQNTLRIAKTGGPEDPEHAVYVYPEEGLGQKIANEDYQEIIDNGDLLELSSDGLNYL